MCRELALIMYLCDNDYPARFIRLIYFFSCRCMKLAVNHVFVYE